LGAAQYKIADKLGLDLMVEENRPAIGNIRQLFRMSNTWNLKRKRYCIPIIEDDLNGTYEDLREKAKRQRIGATKIYGHKILDISKYDRRDYFKSMNGFIDKLKIDPSTLKKSEDILGDFGISNDMICKRIKRMLRPEAGFAHREETIIYCRDKLQLTPEQTAKFLYNILNPARWIHCMETGSIERLYMKVVDEETNRPRYRYSYRNFCDRCYQEDCELRYI